MKIITRSVLVPAAFLLLTMPAVAGDQLDKVSYAIINPQDVKQPVDKDKALASKYSEFENFAKSKVQQFNRNLRFSRSRMKITRQPDGTFRARYHQIDDSTLGVKVRRSQSSSIPFVGVLSYKEQVFESSAATPEQFDKSLFALVEVIPNRHIFSYRKGIWD
ncbi:MAG: hypothetical protein IH613_07520 [Desulfuromonadales bacterium]|nr:hypothetical protein [Desulfuromonadales bacterium]